MGSTAVVLGRAAPLALALWLHGHPRWAEFVLGVVVLGGGTPFPKIPNRSPKSMEDLVPMPDPARQYRFPTSHPVGVMMLLGNATLLARQAIRSGRRR